MAEEQKWQEASGHTLCANNCGFFGSPTTHNLCSKCFKDLSLKEQQLSQAKLAVENSFSHPESSSMNSTAATSSSVSVSPDPLVPQPTAAEAEAEVTVCPPAVSAKPNRCSTCRRRVGLTGFTCRCGITFCGTHRYPEQHGCTFDFKTLGKEAIAKANPLIKGEKLEKI